MREDDDVTFIADWSEAHPAICASCAQDRDVLTFNADEIVVDLCRPCALTLATGHAREALDG